MSSMAKIFVVVNLLLGVAAFGSAATLLGAQNDYRAELENQIEANVKLQNDLKTAQDEYNENMRSQQQQASDAINLKNTAEQQNESLRTQLADAKNANDVLRRSLDTLTQQVQRLTDTIEKQKEWQDKLTQQSQEATDAKTNALQQLENETANRARLERAVADLNEQIQTLGAQKGDLEKELRNAKFWNDKMRKLLPGFGETSEGADGRVLAVKDNLVVISVGRADKVRPGDVYHLRRGATYVGQIMISRVEENQAVGEFDTQFTGSGGMPQKGDVAYTGNR
jgi:hypothetical protein